MSLRHVKVDKIHNTRTWRLWVETTINKAKGLDHKVCSSYSCLYLAFDFTHILFYSCVSNRSATRKISKKLIKCRIQSCIPKIFFPRAIVPKLIFPRTQMLINDIPMIHHTTIGEKLWYPRRKNFPEVRHTKRKSNASLHLSWRKNKIYIICLGKNWVIQSW